MQAVNIWRFNTRHPLPKDGEISPAVMVGYFILTMAIVWPAAVIDNLGEACSVGAWLPPSLLTLFFVVLGAVLHRSSTWKDEF